MQRNILDAKGSKPIFCPIVSFVQYPGSLLSCHSDWKRELRYWHSRHVSVGWMGVELLRDYIYKHWQLLYETVTLLYLVLNNNRYKVVIVRMARFGLNSLYSNRNLGQRGDRQAGNFGRTQRITRSWYLILVGLHQSSNPFRRQWFSGLELRPSGY